MVLGIESDVQIIGGGPSSSEIDPVFLSQKGVSGGVATLNGIGKVPENQLPSYISQVEEFADYAALPPTGIDGVIYITLDNNKTWRWSGSTYVQLNSGLILGETSSTAYYGDKGKIAYGHTFLGDNPHNVTKTQIGLSNIDNTSDVNKPISTATQNSLDLKQNLGFIYRMRKESLNQNIASNQVFNILSLLSIPTDIFINVNIANNSFSLASGILKFPARQGLINYLITVVLSGTISGPANTSREFKIELVRSNNTLLRQNSVVKISDNSLDGRMTMLTTYTNGELDPFVIDGVKLNINNISTQSINITVIDMLIQAF